MVELCMFIYGLETLSLAEQPHEDRCLTLSGCGMVSTHLGQAISHSLTVQSALALARIVLTRLFHESPRTASL